MAITKNRSNVNIANLHEYIKVQFICPICKSKKMLKVPKSVINQAKQLTTMSIAKGLVCEHQFQAFVDKNFNVRGYQKVDFEFENKKIENQTKDLIDSDDDLFENLIMEGNYLEYKPRKLKFKDKNNQKKKDMSLKEIYEEFWEFIDDDNEEFREFIKNDDRRRKYNSFY
ncbi:MAG: hypothetical protein ACFE8L_14130 [Candidatus Hodarchaeota archaeon]